MCFRASRLSRKSTPSGVTVNWKATAWCASAILGSGRHLGGRSVGAQAGLTAGGPTSRPLTAASAPAGQRPQNPCACVTGGVGRGVEALKARRPEDIEGLPRGGGERRREKRSRSGAKRCLGAPRPDRLGPRCSYCPGPRRVALRCPLLHSRLGFTPVRVRGQSLWPVSLCPSGLATLAPPTRT